MNIHECITVTWAKCKIKVSSREARYLLYALSKCKKLENTLNNDQNPEEGEGGKSQLHIMHG